MFDFTLAFLTLAVDPLKTAFFRGMDLFSTLLSYACLDCCLTSVSSFLGRLTLPFHSLKKLFGNCLGYKVFNSYIGRFFLLAVSLENDLSVLYSEVVFQGKFHRITVFEIDVSKTFSDSLDRISNNSYGVDFAAAFKGLP